MSATHNKVRFMLTHDNNRVFISYNLLYINYFYISFLRRHYPHQVLKGIISAHTREHPLTCTSQIACKGSENRAKCKINSNFFAFPRCILPKRRSLKGSEKQVKSQIPAKKFGFLLVRSLRLLHCRRWELLPRCRPRGRLRQTSWSSCYRSSRSPGC